MKSIFTFCFPSITFALIFITPITLSEITDDVDWNHLVVANKADPIVDRVKKEPDDVSQAGGMADVEIIQNEHGYVNSKFDDGKKTKQGHLTVQLLDPDEKLYQQTKNKKLMTRQWQQIPLRPNVGDIFVVTVYAHTDATDKGKPPKTIEVRSGHKEIVTSDSERIPMKELSDNGYCGRFVMSNDNIQKTQKFNVFCEDQPIQDAKFITLHIVDHLNSGKGQSLNVDKISINFEENENSATVEDRIPQSDRVKLDNEIEKHRQGLWIEDNTAVPEIHPDKMPNLPLRKEGETCGGCNCPPAFTMGNCSEGLECVREKEGLGPGKCFRLKMLTRDICGLPPNQCKLGDQCCRDGTCVPVEIDCTIFPLYEIQPAKNPVPPKNPVCTRNGGCVRHPYNCSSMDDCNLMVNTTRDVEKQLLNVSIAQQTSDIRNTTDSILPRPYQDDMMFFIVAKTSEKEKYMFMCHLGMEKIYLCFQCLDNTICPEKMTCVPYNEIQPVVIPAKANDKNQYHQCAFSLPEQIDVEFSLNTTNTDNVRFSLSENNFWYPTVGWCDECKLEQYKGRPNVYKLNKQYKIYGQLPNLSFPTDFHFPKTDNATDVCYTHDPFRCNDTKKCIGRDKTCDGIKDCDDGYDENFGCTDNPCAPNPCRNGGNCKVENGDFKCICQPGFEGETCEKINPCDTANGGCAQTCTNINGVATCSCSTGTINADGLNCDPDPGECQPCYEAGGCHQDPPGCSSESSLVKCKLDTFLNRTGYSMNNTVKEIVVRIKNRRIKNISSEEWTAVQFHPVNRTQKYGVLFLATDSGNLTGPIVKKVCLTTRALGNIARRMSITIECPDFLNDSNFTINYHRCDGGDIQCLNVTIDTSVPFQPPDTPGVAFDPGVFYYPIFASGDNITISTDKIVINENMEVDTNSMDARCPYSTDFIWGTSRTSKTVCPAGKTDLKRCFTLPGAKEPNDLTCIATSEICDGKRNCRDGVDEIACPVTSTPGTVQNKTDVPQTNCPQGKWRCANGLIMDTRDVDYPRDRACIFEYEKCDGDLDCMDGSDEDICDANRTCDGKQFDCNTTPNGTELREPKCIKTAKVCDGNYDCINMHDEQDCDDPICDKETQFSCFLPIEILPIKKPKCKVFGCRSYVCKTNSTKNPLKCAQYDCMEFSCQKYEAVPPIELARFKRSSVNDPEVKCIAKQKMCDGKIDCPNGRDEIRKICGQIYPNETISSTPKPSVQTTERPTGQTKGTDYTNGTQTGKTKGTDYTRGNQTGGTEKTDYTRGNQTGGTEKTDYTRGTQTGGTEQTDYTRGNQTVKTEQTDEPTKTWPTEEPTGTGPTQKPTGTGQTDKPTGTEPTEKPTRTFPTKESGPTKVSEGKTTEKPTRTFPTKESGPTKVPDGKTTEISKMTEEEDATVTEQYAPREKPLRPRFQQITPASSAPISSKPDGLFTYLYLANAWIFIFWISERKTSISGH